MIIKGNSFVNVRSLILYTSANADFTLTVYKYSSCFCSESGSCRSSSPTIPKQSTSQTCELPLRNSNEPSAKKYRKSPFCYSLSYSSSVRRDNGPVGVTTVFKLIHKRFQHLFGAHFT